MCLTCGCGEEGDDGVRVTRLDQHSHGHEHGHAHAHPAVDTLVLEERVLARNDHLAEHVRAWLAVRRILAVNLMSSPGSGKTSLLERTVARLAPTREVCVIEGDQETTFDAERIQRAGARAVQVNTGAGCHLDAGMVQRALEALAPAEGSLLFVENVGNLVCPALFDVGEHAKVVVISVTEGDDKPLEVPPHVPRRGPGRGQQDRPAPLRRLRRRRAHRAGALAAPRRHRAAALGAHRRGTDDWYAWLDRLASTHDTPREGAVHGAAVRP